MGMTHTYPWIRRLARRGAFSAAGLLIAFAAASVAQRGAGDTPAGVSLASATTSDVVAMASTPHGGGYWLVGADGGVFAFGTATYRGSLPALPAAQRPQSPVVALVPTADGAGYWEATAAGDIYSFGDATFHGSLGSAAGAGSTAGTGPAPAVWQTLYLPGFGSGSALVAITPVYLAELEAQTNQVTTGTIDATITGQITVPNPTAPVPPISTVPTGTPTPPWTQPVDLQLSDPGCVFTASGAATLELTPSADGQVSGGFRCDTLNPMPSMNVAANLPSDCLGSSAVVPPGAQAVCLGWSVDYVNTVYRYDATGTATNPSGQTAPAGTVLQVAVGASNATAAPPVGVPAAVTAGVGGAVSVPVTLTHLDVYNCNGQGCLPQWGPVYEPIVVAYTPAG